MIAKKLACSFIMESLIQSKRITFRLRQPESKSFLSGPRLKVPHGSRDGSQGPEGGGCDRAEGGEYFRAGVRGTGRAGQALARRKVRFGGFPAPEPFGGRSGASLSVRAQPGMAGRAEVAAFARKRQEIFVAAMFPAPCTGSANWACKKPPV